MLERADPTQDRRARLARRVKKCEDHARRENKMHTGCVSNSGRGAHARDIDPN
jgi:hypothetical protein